MVSRWKRDLRPEERERLTPAYHEAEARRLAVSEWAQGLVGLQEAVAVEHVAAAGYLDQGYYVQAVLPHHGVTADSDGARIRLFLDQAGRVKWAGAG